MDCITVKVGQCWQCWLFTIMHLSCMSLHLCSVVLDVLDNLVLTLLWSRELVNVLSNHHARMSLFNTCLINWEGRPWLLPNFIKGFEFQNQLRFKCLFIYIYINVISLLSVRKSLLKYLNYLKQTYCSAVVDTKLLLFILMFTVAPEIVLFFFFWFNFVNCFTFFSFSSSRLPEVLFWFLCRCCNVNSMKNQFDQPAD